MIGEMEYYYNKFALGWISPGSSSLTSLPLDTLPYKQGMTVYMTSGTYPISEKWEEFNVTSTALDNRNLHCVTHRASLLLVGQQAAGGHTDSEDDTVIVAIRGNLDGSFTLMLETTSKMRTFLVGTDGKIQSDSTTTKVSTYNVPLFLIGKGPLKESPYAFSELSDKLLSYGRSAKLSHSDMCAEYSRSAAVQDISALESNNLENAAGLKGSFSILNDLVKGYHAIKSGDIRGGVKAVSSCYLWYKYVFSCNVRDSKDISKNTGRLVSEIGKHRFSNERRRGQYKTSSIITGDVIYSTIYHTVLRDKVYAQLWSALEKFGLHPSAGQAWDLLPFSFVVDWFVKIGPTLREIESYNTMCLTRDIKVRIESYKTTKIEALVSPKPSLYEIVGPYKQMYYRRLILSGPGQIDPLSGQTSTANRSSQMTQGAALIVQQLHK